MVGLDAPDDAAVYQISEERAIITTTDFFPPIVDDPYDFGAIAAANALSDVYAMGGEPLTALNLVAFPDDFDHHVLTEILRGGAETVRAAGAVIAGGHTVSDREPKYGLAVTGEVHPQKLIRKGGAQVGDQLILTKPLGSGVITTALKQQGAHSEHVSLAVDSMKRLNRNAARIAQDIGVHAMTDITGFGLIGHGHEMAHLSEVAFRLYFSQIAFLPGAIKYADKGIFSGGTQRNQDYFSEWVQLEPQLARHEIGLLYDPQTSGGLLMSVAPERSEHLLKRLLDEGEQATQIGEVVVGNGQLEIFE